ncbi:MAG: ACT domain-containing protein, partial [Elusimicrobia bacterium]|nr:ACT domain-containing protein [Elusimicrobiota bacterium]
MKSDIPTAVLLLHCPDQKGLVAAVSDFIFRNNGNIVHADQHTDFEKGVFLQRIEFELKDFLIPHNEFAEAFHPLAKRFQMTWTLRLSGSVPRVAIFAGKEAHCVYDLLSRWRMGEFKAEFPLLISNHNDLKPVAEQFGTAFCHFPIQPDNKTAQES